jgi:diguanylate cyclase (GGDEF)-like protein
MVDKEKRLLDILRINTYKLQKLYLTDPITGLPNLRFITEYWKNCLKGLKEIAVLVIDLRRTKNIKAVFGYEFLDELSKAIADLLRNIPGIICLASLHGGRFVAFASYNEAEQVAQNILKFLSGKPVLVKSFTPIIVSVNIGIAKYPLDGSQELINAIRMAELATEESKKKGVNLYEFFSEEFIKEVEENVKLEELLREYQISGKIHEVVYPVFQIKVDTRTEEPRGAEVLMRIKGVSNIGKAIVILEETGLLKEFFPALVGEALPFMEKAINLIPEFNFAFNISPIQLHFLKEQLSDFMNLIFSSSVDSQNIELEITETSLLENEQIIEQFNAFTELGFKIAIDDFGRGYSSFDRILSLKASTVKLDKKLIDFMSVSSDPTILKKHFKFIENLVKMLKNLDFTVVAEGVENDYQVQFLKNIGVDQIQGYYYAKPVKGERFLECLKSWKKQKKCF